jgi:hypothetical protein
MRNLPPPDAAGRMAAIGLGNFRVSSDFIVDLP